MANTGNETRTRMVFSPLDFKSSAYTIPPCQQNSKHGFEDSAFISPLRPHLLYSRTGVAGFEPA